MTCAVPGGQWTKSHARSGRSLALDDEHGLAREHEEVLLILLPVIAGHRLARLEHAEVDAELSKARLALEVDISRASLDVVRCGGVNMPAAHDRFGDKTLARARSATRCTIGFAQVLACLLKACSRRHPTAGTRTVRLPGYDHG